MKTVTCFRLLLLPSLLLLVCCAFLPPVPARGTIAKRRVHNKQYPFLYTSFLDPSALFHDETATLLESWTPSSSLIPDDGSTKLIVGSIAFLLAFPLLIALVQGGISIVNFRKEYANAPVPKIPCHGVVIATETDEYSFSKSSSPSLRILVIGDSLAVGVGQSVRATPTLPESIATQLSKTMQASAVYWTCFGETGASTPWIIRMIEQANVQKYDEFAVDKNIRNSDYEQFQAEGLLVEDEGNDRVVLEWKKRLGRYRQTFRELYFDPESWGTFDIVVLLTGANDLKSVFFPFLLDEEDKELRREIKNRKGGVIDDIELFMDLLIRKMENGMQTTLDSLAESAEELSESVRRNIQELENQLLFFNSENSTAVIVPTNQTLTAKEVFQQLSETVRRKVEALENQLLFFNSENSTAAVMPTSQNQDTDATQEVLQQEESPPTSLLEPLFALPGSPIRLVPAFRIRPLQWFALPIVDLLNRSKENFAESFPCDILFVPVPPLSDAIEYEARRGRLWNDKETEQVLLSVRAITDNERETIESKMKLYYESKGLLYDTVNSDVALSEWPGKAGTKIFSADTIHPNEAGYDMWGRHIGKAIAERLQEKKMSECSTDVTAAVDVKMRAK